MFLGGYLLWIFDNVFCTQVRIWRRTIGLPWAVLLEGHAWWHLMTGLGRFPPRIAFYVNPTLTEYAGGILTRSLLTGRCFANTLFFFSLSQHTIISPGVSGSVGV